MAYEQDYNMQQTLNYLDVVVCAAIFPVCSNCKHLFLKRSSLYIITENLQATSNIPLKYCNQLLLDVEAEIHEQLECMVVDLQRLGFIIDDSLL